MALTDWNAPTVLLDPGRDIAATPSPDFGEALVRLSSLHREQAREWALSRLIAGSPLACLALMLTAAGALILSDASLKPGFGWSVLVLIGVVAIVRNFIRGAARGLRRVPVQEAAHELKVLLLYCGAAWAGGAFLLMPQSPAPALVFSFVAVPSLALALILKDSKATCAFAAPAAAGVAGAAILGAWPLDLWLASAILAAAIGIILLPALQHGENSLPAGLTLR